MAKEFAKAFYKSKSWRECRNSYYAEKMGVCEICGAAGEEVHHVIPLTPQNIDNPEITLCFDNLMLLCKNCHFYIHDKKQWLKRKNKKEKLRYMFDEDGNIIPKGNIKIVWGSPASGKTTYVKERMKLGDIIVDVDEMFKCFGGDMGKDNPEYRNELLEFILCVRDAVYKIIEQRNGDYSTAWIIAGLPTRKERIALSERMNAELIYIPCTYEKAIAHMKNDKDRTNKEWQESIIKKYFERLEK